MTSKISRYEGAMLGVAIGDALGAPVEFMSAEEIHAKHGEVREMIGGGWLNVIPGEVTDDTQMTLAVAAGIIENPRSPIERIGQYFLDWYSSNPKDIGNTCRAVISEIQHSKAQHSKEWLKVSAELYQATNGNTAGNGALMRTIYPAIFYAGKDAKDQAKAIGKMTHWHTHSDVAIHNYTAAIQDILDAPEEIDNGWAKEQIQHRMKAVRELLKGKQAKPSGWVIDSLVCAADAVINSNNFEDALVKAVNLGGDADTIGAIAGGLAGALYGIGNIPLRWVNPLANARNNALFGKRESTENLLANWCIDAAHRAYKNRTKK